LTIDPIQRAENVENKKYLLIFTGLMLFGCSTFSRAIEPTLAPTETPLPANTLENTRQWTLTPTVTEALSPSPTQLPYTMVDLEKDKEDLAAILYRESQNAKGLGRTPYIQIYADWCPACRALERYMKDERMIDAYRGTYILLVDIDVWQNQLPRNGLYVTGIPAIYELTFEGKPTGRFLTGAAWEENTPENMAPPLDEFFHPK
jgi:thiol-disulfide isomerase/thioredoxin